MIDLSKKYKLTDNIDVLETELFTIKENFVHGIAKADSGNWFPIMAYVNTGIGPTIDDSEFRLVEIGPYDHIQVDDPCYFWNKDNDNKTRGHFAGVYKPTGRPLMFADGRTSFTKDSFSMITFNYCVPKDELDPFLAIRPTGEWE